MKERGASLRVAKRDMSEDEECDDVEFVDDTNGESEEGGVELGSVAITREEMNEFLQSHNAGNSVEEEEVTGDTVFAHVRGKSRHFFNSICGAQD